MTSLHVICGLGPPPQSKILATPMVSRTHFEVLGLEGQALVLEASSPQKMPVLGSEQQYFLNC